MVHALGHGKAFPQHAPHFTGRGEQFQLAFSADGGRKADSFHLPGMHYIDTFGYLLATGYGYLSPEDTLHYDADTNRRLFRYIMKTVTGEDVELPPIPEPAEPEVPAVAGQMAEPQQEEASALQQAEMSAQQPVDASGQQLAETVLQQAEPTSSAVIADLADATVDPDDIDPQPVDGTAQRGDAVALQGDAATQTEGANSQN